MALVAPTAAKHSVGSAGTRDATSGPNPSSALSCSSSADVLLMPSRRLRAIRTTPTAVSQVAAARDIGRAEDGREAVFGGRRVSSMEET